MALIQGSVYFQWILLLKNPVFYNGKIIIGEIKCKVIWQYQQIRFKDHEFCDKNEV